jgi:hypothetical protein
MMPAAEETEAEIPNWNYALTVTDKDDRISINIPLRTASSSVQL